MADETKLHFAVQRAAKAEALLKDELLKEAFEAVEEAYKNQWLNTAIGDTEARERLWQAVRIVKLVHGHLARVVAGASVEKRELAEIEQLGAKRRGFFGAA